MPEIEMFLKINSLYSVSLSVMNKKNASVLHAASFIFLKTQWGLDWGIPLYDCHQASLHGTERGGVPLPDFQPSA